MDTHSVCSCDLVLLPSDGLTAGTARCFLVHRWTCPSFLLPVVFVLLTSVHPSWAQDDVGWQLSLDLVSDFSGSCLDAASFSCAFFAWYINVAKVTWLRRQVIMTFTEIRWTWIINPFGCSWKIQHPSPVCANIAWNLQQVSICHLGGSHIQGMSVAYGGWHTQMNSQDLDTSLDLS